MPTVTTASIHADEEPRFFALYAAVRSDELGMQAWDSLLREQMLRIQFNAQRRGYREQYPALIERFILRDGVAVGWIMIDRGGSVVRCVDIAIVPEERRQGVGTRVLRDLQGEAVATARPLVLAALRTNTSALALYDRLGFRNVGGSESHAVLEWHHAAPREILGDNQAHMDAATFRAHLDTMFVVDPGGARGIPLRLAEVEDECVSGGMEQFSLFFHGPADRLLPQGTYALEHAALGVLALFLVPVVGSNHERIVYQACFSRPASSRQSGPGRD